MAAAQICYGFGSNREAAGASRPQQRQYRLGPASLTFRIFLLDSPQQKSPAGAGLFQSMSTDQKL
jgi:hypothetical protein